MQVSYLRNRWQYSTLVLVMMKRETSLGGRMSNMRNKFPVDSLLLSLRKYSYIRWLQHIYEL